MNYSLIEMKLSGVGKVGGLLLCFVNRVYGRKLRLKSKSHPQK